LPAADGPRNESGINFCPHCHELFEGTEMKMPAWILGLLVVLTATWQIRPILR